MSNTPIYIGWSGGNVRFNGNGGVAAFGATTSANDKVFIDSNMGSSSNSGFRVIYSGSTSVLGEAAFLAHRNSVWSNLYLSGSGSSTSYGLYVDGTKDNYFAGKVGIGTASPSQKLSVNGNISLHTMVYFDDIPRKGSTSYGTPTYSDIKQEAWINTCLLYTSDAADE